MMKKLSLTALTASLYLVAHASVFDPNISNGTCWFAADDQADAMYIPCGNSAVEAQSCCQARDVCLSSRSCYNARWGVTYLAGCSDRSYANDTVCPDKGIYLAQQWVGLVRCFISNDTNARDEVWAPCHNKGQSTVTTPDLCTCNTKNVVPAFTDSPALTNIASLPVSAGNAIAWFDGFTPAPQADTSSLSSSEASSVAITSTPSMSGQDSLVATTTTTSFSNSNQATTISAATPPHYGGLSTSAKVGIGIGSGVAVLVGLVVIAWMVLRKWRKHKVPIPSAMNQIRPRSQIDPALRQQQGQDNDGHGTRQLMWSELDSNEISSPRSELSNTPVQQPWVQTRLGQIPEHHAYDLSHTRPLDAKYPATSYANAQWRVPEASAPPLSELPG